MGFFGEVHRFLCRPEDYARVVRPADREDMIIVRTGTALSSWIEWRGSNEKPFRYWEKGPRSYTSSHPKEQKKVVCPRSRREERGKVA